MEGNSRSHQLNIDHYSDRVSKLFQRLNNIQSDVEEEKIGKFKAMESILMNLERKADEINRARSEKYEQYLEKIRNL